jgi:hypothetical protein
MQKLRAGLLLWRPPNLPSILKVNNGTIQHRAR